MKSQITRKQITRSIKDIIEPMLTKNGYKYKQEGREWNFYKVIERHLVIMNLRTTYDNRLTLEIVCPSSVFDRIELLDMKTDLGLEIDMNDAIYGLRFENETELNNVVTKLSNIIMKIENIAASKLLSNINPLYKDGFVKEKDGKIVDYWGNIM